MRDSGLDLIGRDIGTYRILSLLGAGGMGEVYRARDTKLGREVAIKMLPSAFTRDTERRARFEREARGLATLNHPHIGAIYGLEHADGVQALVLELVEGETLADRIARGPIPLNEAMTMARQIADALEAAHEKGIVHRDLKPANIKITPDGVVKVLDFGLAKAASGDAAPVDLTQSPTLTVGGTREGIILGTAAYMSPEQARGRTADKRADVWAFGVVLYEMLTGRQAFGGETTSDILAKVIEREPDWTALPASTPPRLRELLRRCGRKDPKTRLQAIGDARIQIEELISGATEETATAVAAQPRAQRSARFAWIVVAVSLALAVIAISPWAPWQSQPAPMSPHRLSAELGTDVVISGNYASLALSPDGSVLAFQGEKNGSPQLYIRRLDQLQAVPLLGTVGASQPFFSPDGQWIGFFAEGKLKKVAVNGGAAVPICDAPNPRGGAWGEDGDIVFSIAASVSSPRNSLLRVSPDGGTPQPSTTLSDDEVTHRWPQVLPGARAILYTAHNRANNYADANIVVQTLPNGPRKILQRGGSFGRYVPSGHLVYLHDGTLFAAPFDHAALEVIGPGRPVIENIANQRANGGAQFAVAADGTAVYLPGPTSSTDLPIQWMTRDGKTTPLRATPARWTHPQFSPDETRLAMVIGTIGDDGRMDIAVYDWARDLLTPLTFGAEVNHWNHWPAWTPDSRRITFVSGGVADARSNLYWVRAEGGGDPQLLTGSASFPANPSWHPSGRFLAFQEGAQTDLMILPMQGDEVSGWKPGTPYVFLKTPAFESAPSFSPDGRWLAYHSNESGRDEVYVRPFPPRDGKSLVSSGGGQWPTWSKKKGELLYQTLDNQIMAVPYTVEGDLFRREAPRLWTERRILRLYDPFSTGPQRPTVRSLDLHPDGERVAAAVATEGRAEGSQDKVVFIFNFFDELRRIAQATKH